MLTETARVVAVETDGVWVETIRRSTCGACAVQKGCGHGLMNRIGDGRRSYIRVLRNENSPVSCAVDDQVRISIPEDVILRGSVVVYMLPLACMLGGASAAANLVTGSADAAAAAGAVVGFAAGVLLVRWHAWRHRNDRSLQPTLVDVVPAQVQALNVA
tara:strand:- start:157754 stop:158230 length:477 start_codon:yes stop_codon:yes gene_type:complete